MSIHSDLIRSVADRATARATRLVIRRMRDIDDLHVSGADSGLRNAWEEVCAQVQVEHSVLWAEYCATIDQFAEEAIERMQYDERCAVWLQTIAGEEWEAKMEEDVESGERSECDAKMTYYDEDLVDYIRNATFDLAANWTNPRIRAYNDRSMMRD